MPFSLLPDADYLTFMFLRVTRPEPFTGCFFALQRAAKIVMEKIFFVKTGAGIWLL